jgi:type I restriction enzyme M protein
MAIAEKVGKDRRGNKIFVRDEDGAELKFRKTIERLRKRPNGDRKVTKHEEYQPEIDDDLPRILKKWKEFLTSK